MRKWIANKLLKLSCWIMPNDEFFEPISTSKTPPYNPHREEFERLNNQKEFVSKVSHGGPGIYRGTPD